MIYSRAASRISNIGQCLWWLQLWFKLVHDGRRWFDAGLADVPRILP